MNRRQYRPTYLQCPVCKHVQTIHRKSCSPREEGHIKDLWCHRCLDITKHLEHKQEWMFEKRIQRFRNHLPNEADNQAVNAIDPPPISNK